MKKKLLESYLSKGNKEDIDYLSWLAKALSFSGQKKYSPTLLEIANNKSVAKKLRKYAKISIPVLENYTHWNNIIINDEQWDDNLSINNNRFSLMIRSDEFHLNRLAAKRIHYQHIYKLELLDLIEQKLVKHYQSTYNSKLFINSFAWMTKALAGSRIPKYKKTIELISQSARHKKLRSKAKRSLKYYL
ncbi:hypothetical protein AB835_07855 [Candidatus Endobugula sertula]|uniref:Uncharacterized protein n=1 Tax=Candidatus Endobugula sertula TaxID=62101 RepID=A0A1D2QPV4_9GAMM|nr:hypothetical protein AB835_07855 [Candidatus Endobugula sertula]